MAIFTFALFASLSITVGVLTVCFTVPKPSPTCTSKFKLMLLNPIVSDARPRFATIGDINNDHQMDIVVANSGTDEVTILLGYGNGNFSSLITCKTGPGSSPYSIAIGDFNNNNQPDIVVANYGTNSIGVYLGYGNGTFTLLSILPLGSSRPVSVAVGDFNHDNHLDIAVANYGTDSVGVLLAYGNGIFKSQQIFSTGYDSNPNSIVIADFNSDTHLDIALANYGTNTVGVLLGYGNGSFEQQVEFSTGVSSNPHFVNVADFNSDNQLDICVANSGTGNVGIFLGYGNGHFAAQVTLSTGIGSKPYSIALGDFNNDNRLDICVSNSGTDNVGVFLGLGNGIFLNQTIYSTEIASNPYSVVVADFNNDNRSDIAVINYGTNNLHVLLDFDPTSFQDQATYSTGAGSYPFSVAVGDFNNDNALDIVVANRNVGNIGVLLGYGNGTFATQLTYFTGAGSYPFSVAVGDFNNDKRLDIVVANFEADNVAVLLGYGNGTFTRLATYSTGTNSGSQSVAVGDFNSDNRLDIVVANYFSGNIGVFLQNSSGIFRSQVTYLARNSFYPTCVAVGDFNNDNQLDIIVTTESIYNVGVLFGYGNGTFATEAIYTLKIGYYPYSVAVGDFNNDGRLDSAIVYSKSDRVDVLLGYGNGSFDIEATPSPETGSFPQSMAIGNFNNDNWLDIAVANAGTNNVGVLLGYGNGTFAAQLTYSTGNGSSPFSVAVGDFNNDGRLDVAAANSNTDNVGVMLSDNNGYIAVQTIYPLDSASQPHAVAIADFNNDRHLDIVVANYGTNSVGLLFGYGNGSFANETTISTVSDSHPSSVTVGDFNNDNQLDIAVANYGDSNIGLFYTYKNPSFPSEATCATGDNSFPMSVAAAYFNKESSLNIVVANSGSDSIGVFVQQNHSAFNTQATYSTGIGSYPHSVAVGDFNNDSRLDIVVANPSTRNVGVLLGYGNGTFAMQRMYSTGVNTQPSSVAVGDFNNDNRLDIVVMIITDEGESYVGVLLGYANGTFATISTSSTTNRNYPSSIAVGDFNNDNTLDIVLANSHVDNIGVLLGYGNGTFATQLTYSTGAGSYPSSVAVGDFNNDNLLDIVVTNQVVGNIGLFLGYGNGIFSAQTTYPTGPNGTYPSPSSIAIADFNNDKRFDIVVGNEESSIVGVLLGYGNGKFASQVAYSTGLYSVPSSVAVGDFNNDQQLDIVVVNGAANNVMVLVGYGNGTFTIQATYSTGTYSFPLSVAVGNFNNDSWLDIVVANPEAQNVGVFLGYSFTTCSQTTFSTGNNSSPTSVAVGDFNNDTRPDMAVANYGTSNICIFLGIDTEIFENRTTYFTGLDSHPVSVVIGDFNNDNRFDIAVANSGTDSIGVLLGQGNGTFANPLTYMIGTDSTPYSIAVADFNNDNRLDIVVANYGTNSIDILFGSGNGSFQSTISYALGYSSRPYSVTVGDFNKDNRSDIVVACSGTNNEQILLNMC